jgi:hypothetical protein
MSSTQPFAQIQVGMDVEDAAGAHVGKVVDLRFGDPYADDVGGSEPGVPVGGYAAGAGAPSEPNVPAPLASRLRRIGYIKIDDRRHFRRDRHFYATAEEIASLDGETVHLSKDSSDLIVALS